MAGSAAAPAARRKNLRRGSFIGVPARAKMGAGAGGGHGWTAKWRFGVDPRRRHQPAAEKRDFGTSRWARLEVQTTSTTRLGGRGQAALGAQSRPTETSLP